MSLGTVGLTMSLNCSYVYLFLLIILIIFNLYFFYSLNSTNNMGNFQIPSITLNLTPNDPKDIEEYLQYLPKQYKLKNSKFISIKNFLVGTFNTTSNHTKPNIWDTITTWPTTEGSLFPIENGSAGLVLQAIHSTKIVLVDNAPKGTQLKLLLLLETKQKLFFKPKRYSLDYVVNGSIYAGFDRHNSEVFAYYLAMILNFKWVAPATIRKIHFQNDILNSATLGLKRTMKTNGNGQICIYGKCFYCKLNETVCPDDKGYIEGAAILYFDKQFSIYKSPWRRSYTMRKMEWQTDNNFCKKVTATLDKKRVLNLIDVSIFDFLIQNGDRHRYEMYKDRIVLVDNGKGLGNPDVDELDILAPLYQCCMLSYSTWQRLELLSGGVLSETIKTLSSLHENIVATGAHYKAVERRLLKVYATVQYCIGKHGSARVFQT